MCIRNKASMYPWLTTGRRVGISVLAPDQSAVSNGFAYGVDDPFAVFAWTEQGGVPVVTGCVAYLVGAVERVVVNHDTTVVIVAVGEGAVLGEGALVYWMRGYYGSLVPVGG
jgi:flavin reductase (DIM6/NTAB) family NADH-FMN oxidoreductase RutF